MGNFLKNIIGADERIILLARLHWIYAVQGMVWMAVFTGFGMGLDHLSKSKFGYTAPLLQDNMLFDFYTNLGLPAMTILFGGAGFVIFMTHLVKILATEIALTDYRIVYKTGLLFVDVEEIDLVEIRAEHVHHGFFGRIFGYGRLQLDSRFVGDVFLPAIRQPYKLIKAMHKVRSKLHDAMT